MKLSEMGEVVVGLDVHLKKAQVTIIKMKGEVVKKERVDTYNADVRRSLECVPKESKVALESVGFCWPWIDFSEGLGHNVLLANPLLLKNTGDIKNDKVDSKRLANLTRRIRFLCAMFLRRSCVGYVVCLGTVRAPFGNVA
jgi:transposase